MHISLKQIHPDILSCSRKSFISIEERDYIREIFKLNLDRINSYNQDNMRKQCQKQDRLLFSSRQSHLSDLIHEDSSFNPLRNEDSLSNPLRNIFSPLRNEEKLG